MKSAWKKRGLMVLLLAVMAFLANSSRAVAGSYLGEYCWSMQVTETDTGPVSEGPFLVRAGATSMGGAYYMLQGTVTVSDDSPMVFGGAGTVVGNEVVFTLNGSQQHSAEPWRDTSTLQVRIDLSTLNGTLWDIGNDFNTSQRSFDRRYSAATLTHINCP